MSIEKRIFWYGLVIVFLLALLPRLFYPVTKFLTWYERSLYFWDALRAGNLAETYQRHHPGVTTMWIAGFGLRVYATLSGHASQDLAQALPILLSPQSQPFKAGVITLSIVIAASIALIYVLLFILTDQATAFSAGCFIALDPFHLTHSKMIHVDGLLAIFMLMSALALIIYIEKKDWRFLIASGACTGLALLTKSPALFLVPYSALLMVLFPLMTTWGTTDFLDHRFWSKQIGPISRRLMVWLLVTVVVFFMLWPAMWVAPRKTIVTMLERGAVRHVQTVHPFLKFFAGRNVKDPGPLYYAASLAWYTTLITLPTACIAILLLARQKCAERQSRLMWYLVIYAGFFFLQMTLGAKKSSRYILPIFLALDVLAALGLVQITRTFSLFRKTRPNLIVISALVIQAIAVLRHHPYYGTHHNILLGGSAVASHILQFGDQGEGADQAAHVLNHKPGPEHMTISTCDTGNIMLRENFAGQVKPINHPDVAYRVFYINDLQRGARFQHCEEFWEACQREGPIWSVSFDSVPYAWICQAYPDRLEEVAIAHRLDVQLGEHIQFLGYNLNADDPSAGDTLKVVLFWQSNGEIVADNHVFVHLLGPDRTLKAQHDGVPKLGERPTWTWQPEEIIQDEHQLALDESLISDTYTLYVGMYDFQTKKRLPAIGQDGKRWTNDLIKLHDIHITNSPQ